MSTNCPYCEKDLKDFVSEGVKDRASENQRLNGAFFGQCPFCSEFIEINYSISTEISIQERPDLRVGHAILDGIVSRHRQNKEDG